MVSDAGMPAVSDPGYRLVAAAADEGLRVTAVPGPSAVLTALAVSGLPGPVLLRGLPAPQGWGARGRLAALAAEPRTMVFFEAPHRVAAFLADAADALGGQRRAVACRELTKTHEEVRRGTLGDLVVWAEGEVRGELTLVIEGAQVGGSLPDALAAVQAAVEGGGRLSEAVAEVAAAHGVSRRELYDAALKQRAGR